jgi:hypothetical protein
MSDWLLDDRPHYNEQGREDIWPLLFQLDEEGWSLPRTASYVRGRPE